MNRDRRSLRCGRLMVAAGLTIAVSLVLGPIESIAGDADSVGGYKFKVYEEAPPGDGPQTSSNVVSANDAGSVSITGQSAAALSPAPSSPRLLLSPIWVWLKMFFLGR